MPSHVNHYFGEAIQLQIQIADQLALRISEAADQLSDVLTQDGRIFLISDPSTQHILQHVAETRLLRKDQPLPTLPFIPLPQFTAPALLKSLGQTGDLLLIVQATSEFGSLSQTLQIARDLLLPIIALTGQTSRLLSEHLRPEDLEICIPTSHSAQLHSTQLMVLQCLCQQIDHKLFGALPSDPL